MASISIQTRKVTELSELTNVLDNHYMLIHDGQRLRRVSARTIKQGLNTAPMLQNATSSTVGVVRPDNTTLTVNGGVLSARVATVSQSGVVRPDGTTIKVDPNGRITVDKNALGLNNSSEIVANKFINQNGRQEMKYWYGSKQQYNAIGTKDNNTIYDVYE